MKALDAAVYSKLAGLTLTGTPGIYNGKAQQGAAFPYVVFNKTSDVTEGHNTADARRLRYDVKVLDSDHSPADALTIAGEIDTGLHYKSLTVTGWTCVVCRRAESFQFLDPDDVWNVGLTFEIILQKA